MTLADMMVMIAEMSRDAAGRGGEEGSINLKLVYNPLTS